MVEGKINKSTIRLVYHNQKSDDYYVPLFETLDGECIYSGDTVEFANGIFPSVGIISNYNGLKVQCFNTVLNKWAYYCIAD